MAYRLEVTLEGELRIEQRISYLINEKQNISAAIHLADNIELLYDRIANNPYEFPLCEDYALAIMGYRKAIMSDMNYKLIYKIEDDIIYVVGLFNDLEDYSSKIR